MPKGLIPWHGIGNLRIVDSVDSLILDPPSPIQAAEKMHETLQTKAYQAIRERLLSGLDGQGARISDFALSRELGISRAPIREAMNRLVSERLLSQKAGLGVFVPSPTRREIEDLYQVREWLEVSALEAGGAFLGPREFEELERSCEAIREMAVELDKSGSAVERGEPYSRLNQADADFHLTILQATRNDLALDLMQSHRVLEQIWSFYYRPQTAEVLHTIYDEHRVILDALKDRDILRGCKGLRNHLRCARDIALEIYDKGDKSN